MQHCKRDAIKGRGGGICVTEKTSSQCVWHSCRLWSPWTKWIQLLIVLFPEKKSRGLRAILCTVKWGFNSSFNWFPSSHKAFYGELIPFITPPFFVCRLAVNIFLLTNVSPYLTFNFWWMLHASATRFALFSKCASSWVCGPQVKTHPCKLLGRTAMPRQVLHQC